LGLWVRCVATSGREGRTGAPSSPPRRVPPPPPPPPPPSRTHTAMPDAPRLRQSTCRFPCLAGIPMPRFPRHLPRIARNRELSEKSKRLPSSPLFLSRKPTSSGVQRPMVSDEGASVCVCDCDKFLLQAFIGLSDGSCFCHQKHLIPFYFGSFAYSSQLAPFGPPYCSCMHAQLGH